MVRFRERPFRQLGPLSRLRSTPLIPSTFDHEHVVEFGKDTVWKRPAQPAEIAPAYVFLASADARYITGEILAITGRSGTR
jgi:NAD(P)-dependent dehydrogenase (short-subunit alcohol dehydrogenase family)